MFLMSQDQIWSLAILAVVLLSVGGIIAAVIYWWRDMKRGPAHAPILANGAETTVVTVISRQKRVLTRATIPARSNPNIVRETCRRMARKGPVANRSLNEKNPKKG